MFSARNAILLSLMLLTISVIGGVFNLTGPPDSGGLASDSYGTYSDGYRATYELLQKFQVPVQRHITPPDANLPLTTTLVIWGPHDDLVENEPVYLERLLAWVEKGGRLVVAPPPRVDSLSLIRKRPRPQRPKDKTPPSIWSVLGLPGVDIVEGPTLIGASTAPLQPQWEDLYREATGTREFSTSIVSAVGLGDWESLGDRVKTLCVPSSRAGEIKISGKDQPRSQLECHHAMGASWVVAASFPRGQGEIVVIAEPLLLGNSQIAQVDNAVLTYDLLASGRRSVIFDEFYHGLSVRGNPLWLLTRPGAALLLTTILLALGIGVWRQAIILGPPLESVPPSRRAILEYIDAMGRFLTRSRGINPYLLTEARTGVLKLLGEQLKLPPNQHQEETIAATLARRSPHEAQPFRDAIGQLNLAIRNEHSISDVHTIQVLQRLFHCL